MIHFKKLVVLFGLAIFLAAPVVSVVAPQNTFAASVPADCEKPILGIHPWFRGLSTVVNGKCGIAGPGQTLPGGTSPLQLEGFILRIALNVLDIALLATAYVAFFFALYGGFLYLTGGNEPSQIEKGRKTLLNAVIGLVISLGAVAVVNLIFGVLG